MRSLPLLTLLFSFFLLSAGCVSKNLYQQKESEAAQLTKTISTLKEEQLKLKQQKKELSAYSDELSQKLTESLKKHSADQQDLLRARADIDRLEKVLSARGAEAGEAMAGMRRTIDRIEAENRELKSKNQELQQQVEKEKLARQARIAQMKSTFDELVTKMETEIQQGEVTISELEGKLTVNMVERILFDSGKAEIKPEGLEVLRRVGAILKNVKDKQIQVEGHTDNIPIRSSLREKFPTNWELSATRAINVVHFLEEKVNIDGERLSAAAMGEYRPVADNDTPKGRAQNRRIQIVLIPLENKIVKSLK